MGLVYKSVADAAETEETFSPYAVNGYLVREPLAAAGGGNCKWGIVVKDGREYFLKEFLSPKFPDWSAEISPTMRNMQVKECNDWLETHTRVYQAVQESDCGGLVVPLDFFRFQNHFYLVTEKVVENELPFSDICRMRPEQKILVMKLLAYQFAVLAQHHVIHSDLKPDNLMLKNTVPPFFTVKIIDFDASFLESEPPDAEDMVGDSVYYSPEAIYYQITEGEGTITPQADVFSLGIIFHQILSGTLPTVETEGYDTIGEAVLNGEALHLHENLPSEYAALIRKMLLREPEERISAEKAWEELQRITATAGAETVPIPKAAVSAIPSPSAAKAESRTVEKKSERVSEIDMPSNRWKAPPIL